MIANIHQALLDVAFGAGKNGRFGDCLNIAWQVEIVIGG